jgi:hypothetical protein
MIVSRRLARPMEPSTTSRCTNEVMKTAFIVLIALAALLVLPSASAKDFGPGDLRVCNSTRCVPIVNPVVLPHLGMFYFSGPPPARIPRPTLRAPYYELRSSRNGYVTGMSPRGGSTASSATALTWIGSRAATGTRFRAGSRKNSVI